MGSSQGCEPQAAKIYRSPSKRRSRPRHGTYGPALGHLQLEIAPFTFRRPDGNSSLAFRPTADGTGALPSCWRQTPPP